MRNKIEIKGDPENVIRTEIFLHGVRKFVLRHDAGDIPILELYLDSLDSEIVLPDISVEYEKVSIRYFGEAKKCLS